MKMKTLTNDLEPQFSSPLSNPTGWGRAVKLSYCEFMQKNKPQSNSVAGGLLVLGAGGYHIAWLLWNLSKPQYSSTSLFIQFSCWYFGNIFGSIAGAAIVTKWPKKNIYYLCGTMSTVGGVLFIVWFNYAWLIAVGRFIAGLAHGMAYVATITHGAENVIKEMRGRLIGSMHFLIYSSVFTLTLVMLYSYPFAEGIRTEQMVGIMAISFSLMGMALTPCLTHESVTYLLYRNDERQALENMIKLRNESVVTWNISNDLQEMKLMVAEDRLKSENITKDSNLRPLLLMLAVGVVTALSSNLILNTNLIEVTDKSFMADRQPITGFDPTSTSVASLTLVTFRYAAGIVVVLFGDLFSRKKCFRLSAGLSALSLLIAHTLSLFMSEYTSGTNWIPGAFAIAFQMFVGAGVEPIQHVLVSEAFSTAKKYWSIAFVAVAESLMQIAVIGLSFIDGAIVGTIFIYCSIIVIVVMTIVLHMFLPETRGISLRQARDEFTKTGRPEGITYS